MPQNANLRFEITHPACVSDKHLDQIRALEGDHFTAVFADVLTPDYAREFGVASHRESWNNTNRTSYRGKYAHPRVGLAYEGREVTHMLYAIDSVTARSGPIGRVMTQVALRLPLGKAYEKRTVRLREMMGADEVTLAALAVLVLEKYHTRQKVADYPYQQEEALQRRLSRWGITRELEDDETVNIGRGGLTTLQSHYVAPRVDGVIERIMQIEGVVDMVDYARTTLPKPPMPVYGPLPPL